MSIELKSKIPKWMLVDNSIKSTIFCLSVAMLVLGGMLQLVIRISYVAETAFFFPLYFVASLVLITVGSIGLGAMTLYFLYQAIKAIRYGIFIPWMTDCIQDLNEKPKLKLNQHIVKRQEKKELQANVNRVINNFKKFESRNKMQEE